MKRTATLWLSLAVCFSGFSQNKLTPENKLSYTRAQLANMRVVQDFTKDLPENRTAVSIEVMGRVKNKTTVSHSSGDTLSSAVLDLLAKADIKSKIYIDIRYSEPGSKKFHPKTFSILVLP